jgi:hypothetical protein
MSTTAHTPDTVIELVLPSTNDPATVTVRQGETHHRHDFECQSFADLAAALHESLKALVQAPQAAEADRESQEQQSPATEPVTPASEEPEDPEDPKTTTTEQPPYRLQDQRGAARALNIMSDPFDLQERYHRSNRDFVFETRAEAEDVAQMLVEAQAESAITVIDGQGQPVSRWPQPEVANTTTPYPDQLDTSGKRALFDVLQDEESALSLYQVIQSGKKHGWKTSLIKQRDIKGLIATHIDGDPSQVEALYQCLLADPEFDD